MHNAYQAQFAMLYAPRVGCYLFSNRVPLSYRVYLHVALAALAKQGIPRRNSGQNHRPDRPRRSRKE